MRDKLTNGFDWDRKISSINNNELPSQNANQSSNITANQAPSTGGKPLDKARINSPRVGNPKSQPLSEPKPKKTAANIPDSQIDSSADVLDASDIQVIVTPKPVRRSGYKNVSGMSENDW